MAAVATEHINLNWQNFSSTVSGSFQKLRNASELFDVTLACNNFGDDQPRLIKAHKVILAASSPVLKHLVVNMDNNGMIYLSGIEADHVNAVIDFAYSGQVNIERSKLERFLQVAEELKMEGLVSNQKVPETPKMPAKKAIKPQSTVKRSPPRKRQRKEMDEEAILTEHVKVEENAAAAYDTESWLDDEDPIGQDHSTAANEEEEEEEEDKKKNILNDAKVKTVPKGKPCKFFSYQ